MSIVAINEIHLVGLSLKNKTSNSNGQSAIDCENLWHEFEKAGHPDRIVNRLGNGSYGVYYDHEGDSSKPFMYFIGCPVPANSPVPGGLQSLVIPQGNYHNIIAKGKMPECVTAAWKAVWTSGIPRAHKLDFEVYDERSKDWNNAEVELYISIK